jgi:hypothetical protein
MLRAIGRLELDFIQREQLPTAPLQPYRLTGTLLIAANVAVSPSDAAAIGHLERMIRSQVERQYARHGVPDVIYDLQVL